MFAARPGSASGAVAIVSAKPGFIAAFPRDFCLSYINTLYWRGRSTRAETLHTLADVFEWLGRSGVVSPAWADDAKEWADSHSTEAGPVFSRVIEIREALFGIFSAIAVGARVDERDFLIFSTALANTPNRGRLVPTPAGFAWSVRQKWSSASDILAPALWSAGDLILDAAGGRIRRCANTECLWLFVDQSKTNTRRWCDMGACGNRAKARRHYERSRQA